MEVQTKEIHDLLLSRKKVGEEHIKLITPFIIRAISNLMENLPSALENLGFQITKIEEKELSASKDNIKLNVEVSDELGFWIKFFKDGKFYFSRYVTLQDEKVTSSKSRYYLDGDEVCYSGGVIPNDVDELEKLNQDIKKTILMNDSIKLNSSVQLVMHVTDKAGWVGETIKNKSIEELIIDLFLEIK